MKTKWNFIMRCVVLGTILLALIFLLDTSRLVTTASAQQPVYNTAFLTDAQLENYNSMNVDQIRQFLSNWGSYYRQQVQDADGVTFDPPPSHCPSNYSVSDQPPSHFSHFGKRE